MMRDQPPPRGPADFLTVPGRLLLIATLILAGASIYFGIMQIPGQGLSLPWPMLILPILIFGFLFYVGSAWVLEKLGIRVYNRKPRS